MALKLPTGDPDVALGSGRPDLAFGAALEKTLGRWSLYANLNVTVPIGDRFSGPHLTPSIPSFRASSGSSTD
jgi:hypothetical protein